MKKNNFFVLLISSMLIILMATLGTGCSSNNLKHEINTSKNNSNSSLFELSISDSKDYIDITDTETFHDFKAHKSAALKRKQYLNTHIPKDSQQNRLIFLNSDSMNNPPIPQEMDFGGIPVLMYHSISFEPGNDLRVPREKFQEQMQFLKDNGYSTLTMEQAYEVIHNKVPLPRKSVVITFDDGYIDNYNDAFPILKSFDFTCTIFVITSTVDKGSAYINSSQMKEMSDYGIDIESHTISHEELSGMSYETQFRELSESRAFLEKLLNKKISAIAYPFGKYNKDIERAAKEAGYLLAFTTKYGFSRQSDGIYTLTRVRISAFDSIQAFSSKVTKKNN